MRYLTAIFIAMIAVAPGRAADRIIIGPAAAWIRPVSPPSMKSSGGSTTSILADEQYRLTAGEISSFAESIWRIETPEGLGSGNISLSWQPETETLTVHKLMIRRGNKTIDVLKSGQHFSILRRETNLESAMLDGTLTASIQPEDLQVGDVIDLATTVTSSDPIYRDHVEQSANAVYGVAIGRAHLSAEWPSARPVRLRQTEGLPPLTPKRDGDMSRIELTLDGLAPPVLPSRAPARFRRPRLIELSDFRDWSELAALFVPMYDKAARIPADSPLRAEIERIRAASLDPRTRAEAVLALVQNRVRYVALLMGTGNFVPADASLTWNRRFGDCKAKSALLIAMLRPLGIEADAAIVNTSGNDGLDQRLPMLRYFNHVIVRATIGGKTYWLDGTRTGDRRLDQLTTPDYHWGLPLAQGAGLVRMIPEQLVLPEVETMLRVDARSGISMPAPAHAQIIMRGDDAYGLQQSIVDLTPDQRDKWARDYWAKRYPFIQVKTAGQSYDADKREQRLTMDGVATMGWRGGVYWLADSDLGDGRVSFERDPKEDAIAPFSVGFPYFRSSTETVLLPPGVAPINHDDVDEIAGGIHYRRKSALRDGAFTVVSSTQSITSEFPASEATTAQKKIRGLAEVNVALRLTKDFARTRQEISAELAAEPKTAAEWVQRGYRLLDREDHDGAFTAFDKALAEERENLNALVGRGTAQTWRRNFDAAAKDFAAAEAIDPDTKLLPRARAILAQFQGRFSDAARDFARAIEYQPDDYEAMAWRAQCLYALGDYQAALIEAEKAIEGDPNWPYLYTVLARGYQALGKPDRALAQAVAVINANPDNVAAYEAASEIYDTLGRKEDALRAIGRAIELKPNPDRYIARHRLRRWADIAGRRADIDEALRLDPGNLVAMRARAVIQRRQDDLNGAIATLSSALKHAPRDSDLLSLRGQMHYLAGQQRNADRDFGEALQVALTAEDLNAICWNRAIVGADLRAALSDCDAAITKNPDYFDALDSMGFALAKSGRHADAIAYYNRALDLEPAAASALYGRAIAHANQGRPDEAKADHAAAVALDADVVDRFRYYGLTMPPSGSPPVVGAVADAAIQRAYDAPVTAEDYVLRAGDLVDRGDHDGAIVAFDAALKIDPRNVDALARRGFTHILQGNFDAAASDLKAATVLDPDDFYALRGRAYLAQQQKRYSEALQFYNRALKVDPTDASALGWRAQMHRALGNDDAALRDAVESTRLQPSWVDIYGLRARIYGARGQADKALAEAKAVVAANPDDSMAYQQAAVIYGNEDKNDEALKAVSRAIEIEPSADLFLLRADMRPSADVAMRLQDFDRALRYDPGKLDAYLAKSALQQSSGDEPGAVVTLTTALGHAPNDVSLLSARAQLLASLGQRDEAGRDLAAARAAAKAGDDFAQLCWNGALSNIDPAASLQDCQRALATSSAASLTFSSRGHILLKMGRLDEARSSFDRCLTINPKAPEALLGRAIIWRRKGDQAKANADIAAARKITPNIDEIVRMYDLTL